MSVRNRSHQAASRNSRHPADVWRWMDLRPRVLRFCMATLPDVVGQVELHWGLCLWLRSRRHAVERPTELCAQGVQKRQVLRVGLLHLAKQLVSDLEPQVRL